VAYSGDVWISGGYPNAEIQLCLTQAGDSGGPRPEFYIAEGSNFLLALQLMVPIRLQREHSEGVSSILWLPPQL